MKPKENIIPDNVLTVTQKPLGSQHLSTMQATQYLSAATVTAKKHLLLTTLMFAGDVIAPENGLPPNLTTPASTIAQNATQERPPATTMEAPVQTATTPLRGITTLSATQA